MMETMMPEIAIGGDQHHQQQHLNHLHQLSPTSNSGSSSPPPPLATSTQPADVVSQQQIGPTSASTASSALPKLNEIRCPPASNSETKVIYHLEDKDIPTMVRIPIAPSAITLRDLKAYLSLRNSSNYKFYFKARDKDYGIVKEEIFHDSTPLPFFQDKVVAYIESIEGTNSPIGGGGSEGGGMATNGHSRSKHDDALPKTTRHGLVSDSTFSTDHGDSTTETDSMISSRRGGQYLSPRHRNYCKGGNHHHSRYGKCGGGRRSGHHHGGYDSSVVSTSDMESYVDSDDDDDDYDEDEDDDDEDFLEGDVDSEEEDCRRGGDFDDYRSDYTSTTEETSVSRQYLRKGKSGNGHPNRRRNNHHGHHGKSHHHRHHHDHRYRNRNNMSRTSSTSSFSEMSCEVIPVILNLDVVNYLGISLVGQTSQKGDGGIYVSSIMKGGAVDIDGRIQPGDMILQVNETNFANLTNDEAVNVIRDAVKKPGPIKLTVAKTWDPNPKGHFTIPRSEPVRPIDPGAWVAHTEAARAKYTSHETNLPLESTLASYNASAIGVGSVLPPSAEMAAAAVASGSDRFLMTSGQHLQHLHQNQQSSLSPFSSVMGGPTAPGTYSASSATSTSMTYPATALPSSAAGGSPLRGSFKAASGGASGQSVVAGQHSVTISNSVTAVAPAVPLSTESSLETIAGAMASPDSGLDIRDRMWLKIRIPSAFIGSDVVHWLYSYVAGFSERKDAKKVASRLLKEGFIRHTINLKNSFSEKCYYVFSEAVLHKAVGQHSNQHQLESSGVSSLEEGFVNSLRLTNENFQPTSSIDQLAALSQHTSQQQQQQQLPPGHWSGLPTPEMMMMMGGGNSTKPNSIYPSMPFMRYWDETSEIQNYGLIGPNSEEGVGILDSLHHSSGLNGATNHLHHHLHHQHDPYQSDEQMSQRSGQSVLFNPAAAGAQLAVSNSNNLHTGNNSNTMCSSGSAGSRVTNSSSSNNNNHQHQSSSTTTVVSNGNGGSSTANSATGSGVNGGGSSTGGNLLNHHYEDLQMNHATGSLVPVGSLQSPPPPVLSCSSEANEYSGHNYHNQQQHIFAQPSMFRHHHQQLNQDEMLVAMINGGGNAGDGELQQHYSPQSEGGSSNCSGSQQQQYPPLVEPSDGQLLKSKPKKAGFFNRQGSFTSGLPTPANVMRSSFRKAMGGKS